MLWQLNTTKDCSAEDLGLNLLAEVDHFCMTQPASIARQAIPEYQLTDQDLRDPNSPNIARIKKAIEDERQPIIKQALKDLESVTVQMRAAVDSAVAVAKTMVGGRAKYRASISGHFDENHKDGITERVNIAIDVAGV